MIKIKEFDKPFNTPIEETVEVERMEPKVTIEDGKVTGVDFEKVKVKETYKTTYHKLTPTSISCENMHHEWYMADTSRYIASCSKCTKNRFLTPVSHMIKDGRICDRETGRILE